MSEAARIMTGDIQRIVADHFHVDLIDSMRSASRQYRHSHPRMIAMALTREFTVLSLPQIGQRFFHRHHTTVLSACRRVPELCAQYADLADDMIALRMKIRSFAHKPFEFEAAVIFGNSLPKFMPSAVIPLSAVSPCGNPAEPPAAGAPCQ